LGCRRVGRARRALAAGEGATALAAEALRRGQLHRGEASRITGRSERTARDILRRLIDAGLFASETPEGPVSLRFTSDSADALFPRLFPAQATV